TSGPNAKTQYAEHPRNHTNVPVVTVRAAYQHSLLIDGDWRDRHTGDHPVVVDPWQVRKKVHP
ncbi:hypothetical protein RA278_28770, partial [Pseudomonas syringae pv. tagetis]